ncbi:hypothetical protein CF319_g1830 [Tilletia indica]|uniref:Uncharacterized protein n=2 Tax=Tilletia TaxID=13289 RepID=A0A8X7N9L6_9BASI|nr:hypothetical protein CF327_g1952 [Tilletia walkeri]KAE8225432.1 hypothetical protein CF319_g1830 [Tilletia indica]KAE8227618.1 hypothetical protein CF326_g7481 [Tilletia indica]KAE8243703.1 hypothetical protein A4X13_0g6985 [Tilletia indica]KAE8268524.1 hypothetical protein A4X09_0g3822 [Tilletia walkeri]
MSGLDDSDDSFSTAANPTFDQLNFLLISRGYTSKPLLIPSGTSEDTIQALSNTIHALLSQREEDVEVREQLGAQNRTLSATVERLKRAVDEEMRKSEDLERKLETAKVKADAALAAHSTVIAAHKQTQADLVRARTELQGVKVAAHQYRLSINRGSERLKSKLAETSLTALRSVVPALRVATGAFADYKGVRGALMQAQLASTVPTTTLSDGTGANGSGVVLKEQLKELEEERAGLLQSTEVLKRMTTEAVNALRAVDRRLCGIEAEERSQNASTSTTGLGSTTTASSSTTRTGSTKRKAHDAFGNDVSEGLVSIAHEELFPRAHPLRAPPILAYVAADPQKPVTRSSLTTSSSAKSSHSADNGASLRRTTSSERIKGTEATSNTHPAAIALQESISSLYHRLDTIDSRQAAAAAAARAVARAAKRARTLKSPAATTSQMKVASALPNHPVLSSTTTARQPSDRSLSPRGVGSISKPQGRLEEASKRATGPLRQSRIGALRTASSSGGIPSRSS